MVQILIWNGEDRPTRISVDGQFSGANPGVGDTLVVRRGGSAVAQIEIVSIEPQRKRAWVEVLQGVEPEAGDILRYQGSSDATVTEVNHGQSRIGDVVTLLDDGLHPGTKIVTGPNWDDPADYSTPLDRALTQAERQAGELPDFTIVDIPSLTKAQALRALADKLADVLGYAGTPALMLEVLQKAVNVDYLSLPPAARTSIRDNGRVTATGAQFYPYLRLKRGITIGEIERRILADGNIPASELTNYLP